MGRDWVIRGMVLLTAGEDDPFDVCFVGEFVPDHKSISKNLVLGVSVSFVSLCRIGREAD
jgi:hypothetical protein